jgi:Ca2+-binding EF-hand superfamily protein
LFTFILEPSSFTFIFIFIFIFVCIVVGIVGVSFVEKVLNPYHTHIDQLYTRRIMQFTPQQLAGGPKFSSMTRIGNWQEEIALEESKVDNFRKRSATGNLSLRKLESKVSTCSEIVPHSFSADGCVRFGDSVILQHDASNSVLACDPFEQVQVSNESYLVTTICGPVLPRARNTFRIMRPPRRLQDITDREDDPLLNVGQPFVLVCNDSLLVQPNSPVLAPTLYLCSTKKNERTSTKRTNRQMVYMSTTCDADAVWFTSVPSKGKTNGAERFLAVGSPVRVETSYQFTHRQTNNYLSCDPKIQFPSEFGIELECFADRSAAYGKIGLMVSEYKGLSTSQTLSKPDSASFAWHFVMSSDASTAVETRRLPPQATQDNILAAVREAIRRRGVDAFWNLREFLRAIESRLVTPGKVDRLDLRAALVEWGVGLPLRYLDTILDIVDPGHLGFIDIRDLMDVLRGPIVSRRQIVLKRVFDQLDERQEGFVAVADFRRRFRGEDHPLVSMGGFSESQALEHILRSMESNRRPATRVSLVMFVDYYGDLSGAIDDDDYFEAIVRSNFP